MLNIVLFGPPGAGKGTQSELLIEKFGLVHLSTGNLLRAEVSAETELGKYAKQIMDAGKLVPDEVVIQMIANKIDQSQSANGFIFDGFPRTVAQATALDEMLNTRQTPISCMISLAVPEEELIQRLVKRGESSGRSDDNEATARKRHTEYLEKTLPVAGFYQAQNKYIEIEGVGTIETIFGKIVATLQKHS